MIVSLSIFYYGIKTGGTNNFDFIQGKTNGLSYFFILALWTKMSDVLPSGLE